MFHGKTGVKHAAGIIASIMGTAGLALSLAGPASAGTWRHDHHLHHLRVIGTYLVRTAPVSSVTPGGSIEQCIISRESGGNPRAVNPASGAGGKFQFLPQTWASLGYPGLPQNAPVWEQDQAFQKLYAQAGAGPWSSDGCAG